MTQLIIICVYLLLLLCLGLVASKRLLGTKKDFLLASHSIGPFLLLMSLFGTMMTAFTLVGSSGEAFTEGIGVYGMLASSSGIIHSLCFFVVGLRLWSLGRKYGYTTQIQFFRDRLDNDGIGILLFPILVGLVIPYLLIGVISSGVVIQSMTVGAFPEWFPTDNPATSGGVPKWLGSLVICCVVLGYVFFGGMRGTVWANSFQTMVFVVLGIVTFLVITNKLGGADSLLENLRKAAAAVPYEKVTRVGMSKTKFFTYLLVPLSAGMFPHLFQHWLTAKSAASFKLSIVAHPLLIMILWAPCVLIGIWASSDLIEIPPLIAANPNQVLPFLVQNESFPVLAGLLAAGILAAIMSSLDSQFLCLGTIFSNDIITHYIGEDRLSDRQQVALARTFIAAIVAVTYGLSLFPQRSVFGMGVWCFSGFASLFPLVLAAIYWKRLTAAGAYAAMLATMLSWFYLFWRSGFGADRTYTVDIRVGDSVYQTMPVVTIFLCSTVAMSHVAPSRRISWFISDVQSSVCT